MCGRYTLHLSPSKLAQLVAASLPEDYEPDYNIAPGREVLALAPAEDRAAPRAAMHHWGLKTPQNFHVNARIETADTAPRFRESWEACRCLLPASGFYEWYEDGIRKQPYYFRPAEDRLMFLAGLRFPAAGPEGQAACVVLTAAANESVRGIHHRMPIALPAEARADWLANRLRKEAAVAFARDIRLQSHPVSRRVNRVRNNDSKLVDEVAPATDDQMMLF